MDETVKRFPITKITAPNHRPRTITYPEGGDPEVPDDRYELFYQAFCLTGGSPAAAYDMAMRTWDEKHDGPAPTKNQVESFARHRDWRNRFLTQMLDPVQSAAWNELADAQLAGLQMAALETIRDVTLGNFENAKAAVAQLRGAQTILFMVKTSGRATKRSDGGILGSVKAEVLERGNDDLSEEEVTRRITEDWEREKAAKAANKKIAGEPL